MSFETIRIHRDIPAIDGFLQVPPNKEKNKNTGVDIELTTVMSPPLGTIVRLGKGNRQRGSRYGSQEFFRLDGIRPDQWYDTDGTDPVDSLRTTAD